MNEAEIRAVCLDLMATTEAVYLTVLEDDGYPRTRAMLNLRYKKRFPDHVHLYEGHDDDFMIYISTNTSSRKAKDILANPKVGLYFCHPEKFLGMSLIGDVEIIEDQKAKDAVWAKGWEQYYPTTGDASDPDYTLLRILPKNARGWIGSRTFEFSMLK